ncbi:MAG TPA: D-alanyl-D-alanine carboxypeptidase [Candidatus Binataceae bacterium]|nr:D-alanyl-D-alanine carboxypeptidase [Candidatus Binataceae bacterium]
MKNLTRFTALLALMAATVAFGGSRSWSATNDAHVPADIQAVIDQPLYRGATWGLRVVSSGKVLIDLRPRDKFFIGSVRKIFSVGELLNQVGPRHTYDTPVYRRGRIDRAGILQGDLIMVASGDLTMGGRINPDGTVAITNYDHNEADSLGNAVLTAPDPLAGYVALARQVAASGIKEIVGNVIIDDRLFRPFNFRGEFDVKPIFVNDDVIDLTINPSAPGTSASVKWRPQSAALRVSNQLMTSPSGSRYTLKLDPEFPPDIGKPDCMAAITGQLPADFVPPLTNRLPLVQTIRIVAPSNYARTVFIEALAAAGIKIDAPAVARNPIQLLPPRNSYRAEMKVAELKGMPYSDDAKLILKVSYNIGADTSLMLFGLTQGVDNMRDALRVERKNLAVRYGVPDGEYFFVDGSGGGATTATNRAVTTMLAALTTRSTFPVFFDSLPILGVDGSLGFVTDFRSDPSLAGAAGQVRAKTGTYAQGSAAGIVLKGQAFGGYIKARSGKRLIYELVVNNVKVGGLKDLIQVFQDEGRISAILWREN